jgi:6-phosphogluconolactonase
VTRPEVLVASEGVLIERLAHDIEGEAGRADVARGRFALAIPGGSVVPALKAVTLDWTRTHVFWVDERAVPPSSGDSNFGLARTLWLDPAGAPPSATHRMPADEPDLNSAAARYGDEIKRVLGERPQLDVVVLGVGPDGHVASLFPGHPALSEEHRLVVPILDSPKPPARRLTITLPLLTSAQRVIVMALGTSKAAVMHEALTREDSMLPISLVLRRAQQSLVLLDEEAGSP